MLEEWETRKLEWTQDASCIYTAGCLCSLFYWRGGGTMELLKCITEEKEKF